ncbi:uncharacterized protein LOC134254446, partial [Saccostrea cucullata]|uniref:uncharacterized protein LOC134254446 n=1 Tax=Saccostrea cuccullata TaxID=36930 RepID=UPI002ED2B55D
SELWWIYICKTINREFGHLYTNTSTNHLCNLCCVHQTDEEALGIFNTIHNAGYYRITMRKLGCTQYSSTSGRGMKMTGLLTLSLVAADNGSNSNKPVHSIKDNGADSNKPYALDVVALSPSLVKWLNSKGQPSLGYQQLSNSLCSPPLHLS